MLKKKRENVPKRRHKRGTANKLKLVRSRHTWVKYPRAF